MFRIKSANIFYVGYFTSVKRNLNHIYMQKPEFQAEFNEILRKNDTCILVYCYYYHHYTHK